MNKKLKLITVIIILLAATFTVYKLRLSFNQDNTLPTTQNLQDQATDSAEQSAEGKIVYANCGNSDTSCDGFGFIEASGKYWLISKPNKELSEYVSSNTNVLVSFKTVTESTIEINTIVTLP